jgi:hypothetical protein
MAAQIMHNAARLSPTHERQEFFVELGWIGGGVAVLIVVVATASPVMLSVDRRTTVIKVKQLGKEFVVQLFVNAYLIYSTV